MRLPFLLLPLLLALEPALARAQAATDAAPSPPAAADTAAPAAPKTTTKAKPKAKKRTKKVVKPAPADAAAPSSPAPGGPATSGQDLGGAAVAPLPLREPPPPPAAVPDVARPDPALRAADAAPPPAAAPPVGTPSSSAPSSSSEPALRHFGLQLDAGFPGGAAVEVVFRPAWWLRASAGPAYNVLGFGLRAGVGLVPAQWAVTPTLNLDYGHFFGGDLNRFVTASNAAESAVLDDAAYDFFSGTIGLEFGSQRSFAFYLRGGLTYLWANVPAADATSLAQSRQPTGTTMTSGDVHVRGLLPAFSLGFIWYLF